MNTKKDIHAMMVFAAMAGMGFTSRNNSRPFEPEEIEPVKAVIPKGCSEYTFYGITVIAINEKSARKKCAKKARIKP
jgi:hypothetical protein